MAILFCRYVWIGAALGYVIFIFISHSSILPPNSLKYSILIKFANILSCPMIGSCWLLGGEERVVMQEIMEISEKSVPIQTSCRSLFYLLFPQKNAKLNMTFSKIYIQYGTFVLEVKRVGGKMFEYFVWMLVKFLNRPQHLDKRMFSKYQEKTHALATVEDH